MTHYNLLVIGFGKAGKTLAKYAASQGQHVALVEQSSDNFGGTCINHGCILLKYSCMTVLTVPNLVLHFQEKKK